jgi:nucleoside phosphorylase
MSPRPSGSSGPHFQRRTRQSVTRPATTASPCACTNGRLGRVVTQSLPRASGPFGPAPPSGGVVVLTALDLECAAVCRYVSGRWSFTHPAGTIFEMGKLTGTDIDVAVTVVGCGTSAAAVLTERAIAAFQPRALFFTGVAGALKSSIRLGDVVVATKIYGYHGGRADRDEFRFHPEAWEAPHRLEQLARQVGREGTWHGQDPAPAVHFKPIASGDVVLNSRTTSLATQIDRNFSDAVAIEMESAGAAKAGHLYTAPILTVRGISDKADGAKRAADRAGWQDVAAGNAAAFLAALIARVPVRT